MKRGSRGYGCFVIGSTMSQIITSVGCWKNGSIKAVDGSGTINMSLSLIACQPRIDEPSKPRPSSNTPSVISDIGNVQCCHTPGQSTNRRSATTALLSFAYLMTCLASIVVPCQ